MRSTISLGWATSSLTSVSNSWPVVGLSSRCWSLASLISPELFIALLYATLSTRAQQDAHSAEPKK
jgi:hypothetical protein